MKDKKVWGLLQKKQHKSPTKNEENYQIKKMEKFSQNWRDAFSDWKDQPTSHYKILTPMLLSWNFRIKRNK